MVLFWVGSLLLLDCGEQYSSLTTPKSAEEIPTVVAAGVTCPLVTLLPTPSGYLVDVPG